MEQVGNLDDADSIGLLLPTNASVDRWTARLKDADIQCVPLSKWSGRPKSGVKVGTYHRSKGLEFKHVMLPGMNATYPRSPEGDTDALLHQGSALYVAMSRARDVLDLTYVGEPSYFLGPVAPFCDREDRSTQN